MFVYCWQSSPRRVVNHHSPAIPVPCLGSTSLCCSIKILARDAWSIYPMGKRSYQSFQFITCGSEAARCWESLTSRTYDIYRTLQSPREVTGGSSEPTVLPTSSNLAVKPKCRHLHLSASKANPSCMLLLFAAVLVFCSSVTTLASWEDSPHQPNSLINSAILVHLCWDSSFLHMSSEP